MKRINLQSVFLGMIGIIILLFIGFIAYFISQRNTQSTETLQITNTSPSDNSKDVPLDTSFQITFSRSLTNDEIQTLTISISPDIQTTYTWENNNSFLTVQPTVPLLPNEMYEVVISGPIIFTYSFLTGGSETPIGDPLDSQRKSDREFADYWKQTYDKYPWYDSLPLQTENYFVYFDLDKKIFSGILYLPPEDISNPQIINSRKDEITNRLRTLGIPVESAQFEWKTIEKK